jgi:hypothetical protein
MSDKRSRPTRRNPLWLLPSGPDQVGGRKRPTDSRAGIWRQAGNSARPERGIRLSSTRAFASFDRRFIEGGKTMAKPVIHLLAAVALLATAAPASAQADPPNFGDDNGRFAKDGECDDMRFEGPGMTDTLLLDSDIFHDATDCRTAYNQNRVRYLGGYRNGRPAAAASTNRAGARDSSRIQWGDDNGKYAKDGECDDKRFSGPGMTTTPLLDSDIRHDATDCRTAYEQGRLELRQ